MELKSYKELIVWQKAIALVKEIYIITGKFPQNEVYGLASQMRRAAISIPSNIAEGYSRRGRKEYLQFLRISYGSSTELETEIIIAKDLYKNTSYDLADSLLDEILKMLNTILGKLENNHVAD